MSCRPPTLVANVPSYVTSGAEVTNSHESPSHVHRATQRGGDSQQGAAQRGGDSEQGAAQRGRDSEQGAAPRGGDSQQGAAQRGGDRHQATQRGGERDSSGLDSSDFDETEQKDARPHSPHPVCGTQPVPAGGGADTADAGGESASSQRLFSVKTGPERRGPEQRRTQEQDELAPSARGACADAAAAGSLGSSGNLNAGANSNVGTASGADSGPDPVGRANPRGMRHRDRRRKWRVERSTSTQATEAEAHFMFELAKTLLAEAGGNNNNNSSSSSRHAAVFGAAAPASSSSAGQQSGPHRGLQMCAFRVGLFALGLHNRTSPNWLSRTYSSHVSWISGQAMEIGSQAIVLLLGNWERNLTPPEVASIADRASRSNDPAMVRAAAELALSALHMAHALNPGEIVRALSQCRDEDGALLERACLAVENAAHGGGVYPEVLFEVAKHWFYLHEQSQSGSAAASRKSDVRSRGAAAHVADTPSLPPQSLALYGSRPMPLYTTAEQFVQQQMHHQVHHIITQGHYSGGAAHRTAPQAHYSCSHVRPASRHFPASGSYGGVTSAPRQVSPVAALSRVSPQPTPAAHGFPALSSAYRAGMLALESLARRAPDDRPSVKFSKNPPCADDLRWLCGISGKLGPTNVQRFCVSALNAVVSPFLLHDLALEAARLLARANPTQLAANLRSPHISPLVQQSLVMYGQCIHFNLIDLARSEYDDFVELVRHARNAFCMAPGGMSQFNELLQSIRRRYPKKKDLWQMIMAGLAKA